MAAESSEAAEEGTGPAAKPVPKPHTEQVAVPVAQRALEPESQFAHGTALVRATALDLAILAGHLLLYPTGILPERSQAPAAPAGDPITGSGSGSASGAASVAAHGSATGRTAADTPRRLPTEGRAHPPVLLLHGFVDNRSAFTLLRRSLLRNGWTRVQALNHSLLTCDIRTAADQLGRQVEQICEESGHRSVDIVGHSLGGLIARYYVQRLGGDARVGTLVTLGTPHGGTRAIPLLTPHPLIRQMRPGSALLEELATPAPGCRTRFVAFWSDLDQIVLPVEAARLEHPDLLTKNVMVRGIGHLALPVHGTVAAEIRHELTGEEPQRAASDVA